MNQKLIYFAEIYKLEDYHKLPLPVNIYNSSGTILASKGTALPTDKLRHSYILIEDIPKSVLLQLEKKDAKSFESTQEQLPLHTRSQHQPDFRLSDSYREEEPRTIEARLEKLDFTPAAEVKMELRKNIYRLNELFQKKVVNNMIHLSSKNNKAISKDITAYLDNLLESSIFAADYIEMINAVRTPDNYISFGHASAVSFYAVAIAKKLKMLRDDLYIKSNIGRWLPIKTSKNKAFNGSVPFSNQLLKYFDRQKTAMIGKYEKGVLKALDEEIHDIMHLYSKLKKDEKYPSLTPTYDSNIRQLLGMAALNSDLGKFYLPNAILNKPEELNSKEWEVMQQHSMYTVTQLQKIAKYPSRMLVYILGHHKISQDKGYPTLSKELPYETKILVIADIYDAMTSKRHYGRVHCHDEAIQVLQQLHEDGIFDKALFVTALHTFHEYNHNFTRMRYNSDNDLFR